MSAYLFSMSGLVRRRLLLRGPLDIADELFHSRIDTGDLKQTLSAS